VVTARDLIRLTAPADRRQPSIAVTLRDVTQRDDFSWHFLDLVHPIGRIGTLGGRVRQQPAERRRGRRVTRCIRCGGTA